MIDIAPLLGEISAQSPSGENLEYDPLFGAMERAAIGKPEQQFGSTIVPAEEPNWKDVKKNAIELLSRTKDLRVSVELARSELGISGFVPFLNSLELTCGFVELYWDTVHPQLDPDDGNDPSFRVNIIESLCDEERTLRSLRHAPVVNSRTFGRFNLRDVAVANGELPPGAGVKEPPDWTKINAAFEETTVDDLRASAQATQAAIERLKATQRTFAERAGGSNGINLARLREVIQAADKVFQEQLNRRGVSLEVIASSAGSDSAESGGVATGDAGMVKAQSFSGDITKREDVLRCLDKINEYYKKYEPSSPLPLLLDRCKRLVSASFLEIIEDFAPDVLSKISAIGGPPKK
jgi:type VI secretion system protein ImpA